jgi:pyridoxine kinase
LFVFELFRSLVCDPVLGDLIEGGAGKLYVPAEFIDIYRTRLLPLADVWTPNQFEAEQLSGLRIDDEASARQCLEWFHARGVRTVIITSCTYRKSASSASSSDAPNLIHVLGSTIESNESESDDPAARPSRRLRVAHMAIPRLDKYFTGTGDLTAALLLAWLTRTHKQEQEQLAAAKQGSAATAAATVPSGPPRFSFATLCVALERSMATLQAVIRRTYDAQSSELLLIQAKQDIEQPQPTIFVDELNE